MVAIILLILFIGFFFLAFAALAFGIGNKYNDDELQGFAPNDLPQINDDEKK